MKRIIVSKGKEHDIIFDGFVPEVPEKGEQLFLDDDLYRVYDIITWIQCPEEKALDAFQSYIEVRVVE